MRDKATKEPFDPSQGVVLHAGKRAQAHGVITRALGDTVNLCPPLIITEPQIEDLFDRITCAIDDTQAWLDGRTAPTV